jgi:hypothetical protein
MIITCIKLYSSSYVLLRNKYESLNMEELFIVFIPRVAHSPKETSSPSSFSLLQKITTKTMKKTIRRGSEVELQMMLWKVSLSSSYRRQDSIVREASSSCQAEEVRSSGRARETSFGGRTRETRFGEQVRETSSVSATHSAAPLILAVGWGCHSCCAAGLTREQGAGQHRWGGDAGQTSWGRNEERGRLAEEETRGRLPRKEAPTKETRCAWSVPLCVPSSWGWRERIWERKGEKIKKTKNWVPPVTTRSHFYCPWSKQKTGSSHPLSTKQRMEPSHPTN